MIFYLLSFISSPRIFNTFGQNFNFNNLSQIISSLNKLGIFICSFVNFIIQLSVCLWPNWVEMVPKDQILFPNQAAMMGLWRQCIRYLPGKYECDDNQPGYELNENNSPQLLCKF